MTLNAAQAVNLTNNAITVQDSRDLVNEVTRAESGIRNAATRQQFRLAYNASIIGNPDDDPANTAGLTPQQIDFRDTFENSGFVVTRDEDSGYWLLSWEDQGVEHLVNLYSVRTTLAPGAIQTQTIDAIESYFESLTPRVRARVEIVQISGGDIDETQFGAPASTFYEYVALVTQPDMSTDYSAGLKAALLATGLGYSDPAPDNVEVYKLV